MTANTRVTRRTRTTATSEEPGAEAPAITARAIRRTRPVPLAEEIEVEEVEVQPVVVREMTKAEIVSTQDRIVKEYYDKVNSPKTAIRAKCVECMGGYISEITRCTDRDCALWHFRMGKNPYHALSKDHAED